MNKTKQKILDVSLELFSQKGYSAVSIRDICKYVEIKESSIYYHFTNKQSILDELLNKFTEKVEALMSKLNESLADEKSSFSNGYNTIADYFFEQYLMDDFCNKVIRIMLIEQFNNEDIRKLSRHWLMDKPLQYQKNIFSKLIDAGIIPNYNSEYLAIKYYAPIYFYAQKWLFSEELTEDCKEAFRIDAYQHIQMFYKEIGGQKNE